jgi:hypothetical protein
MVGMSPQSQAQATSQVPPQAKYLQAGQPVKQFNAMTANMSAGNPTGVAGEDPYKALLKGDYTSLNPKDFKGGSVEAFLNESEEMKFKRSRMRPGISEEELNRMLYTREQAVAKRDELKAKGLPMAQVESGVKSYLKSIGLGLNR